MTPQVPAPQNRVPKHLAKHAAEWTLLAFLVIAVAGGLGFPIPFEVGMSFVAGTGLAWYLFVSYMSVRIFGYMMAWTAVACGWTAYARVAGEWHWVSAAALIIPCLVLGFAGAHVWWNHELRVRAYEAADADKQRAALLARWAATLEWAGVRGARVTGVEETRAGKTITLELTDSPLSVLQSSSTLDKIATRKQIPLGSITVKGGTGAHEAVMIVNTKDILAEVIPFPEPDHGFVDTVNTDKDVGVDLNGNLLQVLFRWVQVLIAGATGSGKSNLLNVIIARLIYCNDAIIWMIDLKGGRTAAPWVTPWLKGECAHPAIDWVATTRAEAEEMMHAYDAWMTARYRSLSGGSKMYPTPSEPAIFLIVDEGAQVTAQDMASIEDAGEAASNYVIAQIMDKIAQMGRSDAGTIILSVIKATADKVPAAVKAQMLQRFGLGVATETDADAILPGSWSVAKVLTKLRHEGAMLVGRKGEYSLPGRCYRLDHDEHEHPDDCQKIRRMAIAASDHRPPPEPRGIAAIEQVIGRPYRHRWQGNDLGDRIRGTSTTVAAPPPQPSQQAGAVTTRTRPEDLVMDQDQFDAAFEAIITEEGDAPLPATGAEMSPGETKMYVILGGFSRLGISAPEMLLHLSGAGHKVHKSTLNRWLNAGVADGRIIRKEQPGEKIKYRYWPAIKGG